MEIKAITVENTDYQKELRLRDEVLRKPIGLCIFDEDLSREGDDIHIAAFCGGELVGCLMLTPLVGCEIKMRQVAVYPEFQGRGVGKSLVLFAENCAKENGYKKIVLHARTSAVPFYTKLNYTAVAGEFLEVGVPHIKMYKIMV